MRLYNGIELPACWPPRNMDDRSLEDLPVPYLRNPPKVIDISIGRQLFVDSFLIEDTTLEQHFHQASFLQDSPFLFPETPLEMSGDVAAPFTDGCWYDPQDRLYKLWYHAGWMRGTCLAVSEDGKHWVRKMLDHRPGTNLVYVPPQDWKRDGSTVWLDTEAVDPSERYKMFTFYRTPNGEHGEVQVSRDGLHWGTPAPVGQCGDNTSFFYNPLRNKWVFSIRRGMPLLNRFTRGRWYYEFDRFIEDANWQNDQAVFWQRCDHTDCRACESGVRYSEHMPPQLYHLNCVAYESVMLGLFGILKGFDEYDNSVCEQTGFPKHVDLHAAFSRDGFHFSRENRLPLIASTGCEGDWNRGYLHACGGLCLVDDERLLFPVGGFSGHSAAEGRNLYAGASTGMATLRRDGFASLHANYSRQTVTTRLVQFDKGSHLFVNADALQGSVAAEVLNSEGDPISGFTVDDCIPAQSNRTKQEIRFLGGHSICELSGIPIRFRFYLVKADLYAFWVSDDEKGKSGGYVAAGGADYSGNRDV